MIYLKYGDVFLHARKLDSDYHPLKCKVIDIKEGIVTWCRADASWCHIVQTFYEKDINKNVLRIIYE